MKRYLPLLAALVIINLAAQCGAASAEPKISVANPYALSALAGGNGAIYLDLLNAGSSADTLLKVECQAAESAEVHETKIDENEVMQMAPLPKLEVPAGQTVTLAPGGKHIMLVNLKQELKAGAKVNLTLTFEKTGPMTVEVEIRAAGGAAEHALDHGEHSN